MADSKMLKRLNTAIRPQAYRISLHLDPARKGFSGEVEIDVQFDVVVDALELHGQGLTIAAASGLIGGSEISAVAHVLLFQWLACAEPVALAGLIPGATPGERPVSAACRFVSATQKSRSDSTAVVTLAI